MKKSLFVIVCLFLIGTIRGQEVKEYSYYVFLSNYKSAPVFVENGSYAKYDGKDSDLNNFFSNYRIIKFNQAFPEYTDSEKILSWFYLKTESPNLINDLLRAYPDVYLKYDIITHDSIEPLIYPNDFGSTSPVTNSGWNVNRKELDYLNAPYAWDITTGLSSTKVGISDTAFDVTTNDFSGKTSIVNGTTSTGVQHGTNVAAIAAARGNNGYGTTGVAMDCSIVGGQMTYNALEPLANAGVKVINMSWTSSGYLNNPQTGYMQSQQDIINHITEEHNVVLVAAAGNWPSWSNANSFMSNTDSQGNLTGVPGTPFGILYVYPASYDNVISVSSIRHKNAGYTSANHAGITPWGFDIYTDVEDSVGGAIDASDPNNPVGVIRHGWYQNQYNPDGFMWNHTLNEKVDILATGYDIFEYSDYLNNTAFYGSGTSYSSPFVTGTIGLMCSLDNCLNVKETEAILKLTTKDIEHMPINANYFGNVGAGKLEIGKSVDFVRQMNQTNGNAVIKDHIFYRFDFLLKRINNKLTIDKVTFKDQATADLTARNVIEILPGSDFNPTTGFTDLKIDSAVNMACAQPRYANPLKNTIDETTQNILSKTKLYPNPNNGTFDIALADGITGDVSVNVVDITGKTVYVNTFNTSVVTINIPNLSSGIYMVKLSNSSHSETIKFIKQ